MEGREYREFMASKIEALCDELVPNTICVYDAVRERVTFSRLNSLFSIHINIPSSCWYNEHAITTGYGFAGGGMLMKEIRPTFTIEHMIRKMTTLIKWWNKTKMFTSEWDAMFSRCESYVIYRELKEYMLKEQEFLGIKIIPTKCGFSYKLKGNRFEITSGNIKLKFNGIWIQSDFGGDDLDKTISMLFPTSYLREMKLRQFTQ
jgi:hypothetical protein